jgi:hypothetical protein
VSARYRRDEQALGTATTVTSWPMARSRSAGRRYCINRAALRFVACEDLQAEGYLPYRKLRNQAATIEGAKR